MKKLALIIASVAALATPVLACPHGEGKAEAKTAAKDDAKKDAAKADAAKPADAAKADATKAAKPVEKKAEKVSAK